MARKRAGKKKSQKSDDGDQSTPPRTPSRTPPRTPVRERRQKQKQHSESQSTVDADSTLQSHTTSSPTCTRVLCTTTIIVTLLITGIACAGYCLDVNSMLDVIQPRSLDEPIITIEDFPESFQSLPHPSEPANVDEVKPITTNHKEADHILTHQQSDDIEVNLSEESDETDAFLRDEQARVQQEDMKLDENVAETVMENQNLVNEIEPSEQNRFEENGDHKPAENVKVEEEVDVNKDNLDDDEKEGSKMGVSDNSNDAATGNSAEERHESRNEDREPTADQNVKLEEQIGTPAVDQNMEEQIETQAVGQNMEDQIETQAIDQNMDEQIGTKEVDQNMEEQIETQAVDQDMVEQIGTQAVDQDMEEQTGTQAVDQDMEKQIGTPAVDRNMDEQIGNPAVDITKGERAMYENSDITNDVDWPIRAELDVIEQHIEKGRLIDAEEYIDKFHSLYTQSPRLSYLNARLLDEQSAQQRSNALLEQAIKAYLEMFDLANVPDELMMKNGRLCAQRQSFRGFVDGSLNTLQRLSERFPNHIELQNDLGVQYLISGQNNAALDVFEKVLSVSPDNGFAQVHLGFIYKVELRDASRAIPLLEAGIRSRAPGTSEGKFYFHLGDSLQRVGKVDKAFTVYQEGADLGHFKSVWQRSLYNVDSLSSRPWWTTELTTYQDQLNVLAQHWEAIRDEGLAQLDAETGLFVPEDENLSDTGDWKQFTLYSQGRRHEAACNKAPHTCSLIENFTAAASCKRGQVKFSVMHGGVHVWPHCGPTNCRIRAHLGLVVPDGPRIRVAKETRTWKEGEFLIFDDSFEHEVWHNGTDTRLVLIVDVWHPELTSREKARLSPI